MHKKSWEYAQLFYFPLFLFLIINIASIITTIIDIIDTIKIFVTLGILADA